MADLKYFSILKKKIVYLWTVYPLTKLVLDWTDILTFNFPKYWLFLSDWTHKSK